MKQSKFMIGQLLTVNGIFDNKTVVGYVCGIKLDERRDEKTGNYSSIFCYLLSGHKGDWYYEDSLYVTIP